MKQDVKWFKSLFDPKPAGKPDENEADKNAAPAGPEIPAQEPELQDSGVYSADSPITDPLLDRFKRWPFAQRVSDTIISRSDPSSIVIAIYGAWGEGKTTVLNFIDRELKKSPDIITVRFNPWRFGDEVHLLQNFFYTLSYALGKSAVTYKEKIGKWIKDYASILMPFSISMPFFLELTPGESVKNLGKVMSSVEVDELRRRIENFLNDEGKRIVVLMDDIDRLDRSEIQSIFKLVKLSADFAHTAYVLAFDEEMVSSALGEKYGTGNKEAGRNFLEKIVQVPLRLPAADRLALRKFFFDSVDEAIRESGIQLTEEQSQAFVIHFVYGIEPRLQTPRIAKCYRNVLGFSLPILKGRVNPVDLMLVEGVRVFYPKIYDAIRNNPDVFLAHKLVSASGTEQKVKKRSLEIINRGLEGLTSDEAEAARYTLKILFPRLCAIFDDTYYGPEWDERWAREKRVASEEFFRRYFSYIIYDDDISDPELESMLIKLENQSVSKVCAIINHVVENKSPEKFILKLMRNEKKIPLATARNLAVAIARIGDNFPRPETSFSFTTAFSQAGILVGQLIRSVTEPTMRFELARTVIREGSPISFALECFKWMHTTDEKGEQNRLFSYEHEMDLAKLMIDRIKWFASECNLYASAPKDARGLLFFWLKWGFRNEVTDYVEATLAENPRNAVALMKCFLFGAGYELGITRKDEFCAEHYEMLERVASPDLIFAALEKIYGQELGSLHQFEKNEGSPDDRIAYQFVSVHRSRKQTDKSTPVLE